MNKLPSEYAISAAMEGVVVIRRARKVHHCSGGHDGQRRVRCERPIEMGAIYVEYLGEASPFSSGKRYHIDCAVQQQLITPSLTPL